jgi:hypothetical protein
MNRRERGGGVEFNLVIAVRFAKARQRRAGIKVSTRESFGKLVCAAALCPLCVRVKRSSNSSSTAGALLAAFRSLSLAIIQYISVLGEGSSNTAR